MGWIKRGVIAVVGLGAFGAFGSAYGGHGSTGDYCDGLLRVNNDFVTAFNKAPDDLGVIRGQFRLYGGKVADLDSEGVEPAVATAAQRLRSAFANSATANTQAAFVAAGYERQSATEAVRTACNEATGEDIEMGEAPDK